MRRSVRKKYKIYYRIDHLELNETEVEANSKYGAKNQFYLDNPKAEIMRIEEVGTNE